MTVTTAQGVFFLAAIAAGAGLWAAHITANSATRGADWAIQRLPGETRWALAGLTVGILGTVLVEPVWVGLGLVYLAGVVAWTARAVLKGLQRLVVASAYEPLPVARQAALVNRVAFWLLTVAALGVGAVAIDIERRGAVAAWDLLLVAVLAGAGFSYRKRAAGLSMSSEPAA